MTTMQANPDTRAMTPPAGKSGNDAADQPAAIGDVSQIVSFRLANEEYGVDIMRVQEIILVGQITRMPQVPEFICGLINLRGHVIPVVDLRKRFCLASDETTEHTRIIVTNVQEKTIGIVVDKVNEVLRIEADQVEPPPSSIAGIDHTYIRGLVKFKEKLLILLDIEKILSQEEHAQLVGVAEARKEDV